MMPVPVPNPQTFGSPPGSPTSSSTDPVAAIRVLALQAFGTPKAVDFWMNRPNPELSGLTPEQLINDGRAEVIKDFLEGIIAGDFG